MKKNRFSEYIKSFDFTRLFNELGWDNFNNNLPVAVNEDAFMLKGIVEKKGFVILFCSALPNGKIPLSNIRKQIEAKVAKHYFEHLIIYADQIQSQQIWQIAIKEENKPKQVREITWYSHQDTEILFQRLKNLLFTLDEEEQITIVDVKQRISENFAINTESVTKKFYTEFKKQHTVFLDFIRGIDDHIANKDNTNKQWYASLMLNRLMFCYFIQKKGFLNQDFHYLGNKLNESKLHAGKDNFYSFYRSFLLELFHDGLGKPEKHRHNHPIELGKIPYLNGGLFDVHELEKQFEEIEIADDAFENLFSFFDKWNWHLDNSIEATGRDINPDVIGYIFEKYINDRAAMGAYYTKEDITDYIGKNTIIPFLFDETERNYKQGFKTDSELWEKLRQSDDSYIYDAVKKGVPQNGNLFGDLPDEIKAGFRPDLEKEVVKETKAPHLWEIRKVWNTKAPEEIALPTEIYRELIDRRKRYSEIKSKIVKGEINHINDFITYNLNIRQFTQDFIENTKDADFIRHFYKAIKKITILDPTCGSGAFLFAALNILEPLYEACLTRMEQFVSEEKGRHKFFEETLTDVNAEQHPNLQYYIFKNIILNNLYGVDIMKEAVEIAKLRLFLKLVATVDVNPRKDNYGLEPLPDIDFNVRAGNTLIGYATEKELLRAVQVDQHGQYRTGYEEIFKKFKEECELVSKAYKHFQNAQLVNDQGSESFKKAKADLNNRLKTLNHKLNIYLAGNYGITDLKKEIEIEVVGENKKKIKKKVNQYQHWLETHQPFHWFAEFYRIVAGNGGFDCIIGNPPYLEMRQVNYDVKNLQTRDSNAIHSMCIERSNNLINNNGSMSMIVPLALVCTQRMTIVQNLIEKNRATWYSNFAWRPGKLFDQVNRALTIFNTVKSNTQISYSTGYLKWNAEHREYLFPTLHYVEYSDNRNSFWFPKTSDSKDISILKKVINSKLSVQNYFGNSINRVYYRTTGGLYWKVFTNFPPKFYLNGNAGNSSRETSISLADKVYATQSVGLLSSNVYWWWYTLTSNLRDLNPSDISGFKFPKDILDKNKLLEVSLKYIRDLEENSVMLKREQKNIGLTETQSFKISKSKPIIDQIDTVLAQHYGFTEEELDFIINYDIKYRMGKALFGEEENGENEEDED
ncbi:MAG: Eco57I restriction-modification methylase domain-containing protein [Lentimicrobium sp.]|jgi:tRNA1(Val) A37 N6-methylase TrmN6|nr:Eco57I restriction-modification methylase domain-containing protein [Lentimicrobium sp.]